jgi:hypothetical protein
VLVLVLLVVQLTRAIQKNALPSGCSRALSMRLLLLPLLPLLPLPPQLGIRQRRPRKRPRASASSC